MEFSNYNFSSILLDDQYRNKSSFNAELWSLIINSILPGYFYKNDARKLLQKPDGIFLKAIDKHIQDPVFEKDKFKCRPNLGKGRDIDGRECMSMRKFKDAIKVEVLFDLCAQICPVFVLHTLQ